jgi:N6-L-threonylcarbamoyladenine synthase
VGEWVSSQADLHGRYGGVVPELAVREHLAALPLLLREAGAHPDWGRVSRVAVTTGPGLAGCLALGISAAKAVAAALDVPLSGVNHLRAHAWSPFVPVHAEAPEVFEQRRAALLPHAGVLVSGGNTAVFAVRGGGRVELLGSTIDDAAGEALDKGAKLLGLGYPGGPYVERLARGGDAAAFDFPRALAGRGDLDFSFSGLKTSLRYRLAAMGADEIERRRADLCASYQAAVVDVVVRKAGFLLERTGARSLGLSGGVANNGLLRERLAVLARERGAAFLPALARHTGDNAAMIAFAAWADPAPAAARDAWRIEPALALDAQPTVEEPQGSS